MRTLLVVMSLLSTMALVGCETMTVAQQKWATTVSKLETGFTEQDACIDKAEADNPIDFSIVRSQVTYLELSASNKVDLMSDSKKINDSQVTALKKFISALNPCRHALLASQVGTNVYRISFDYFNELDILYAKLLSKEITIGEFNKQKSQLVSQADNRAGNAVEDYRRTLMAEHNQEMNQLQQAAAFMQMNRPVNTNCNQIGNLINCRSW